MYEFLLHISNINKCSFNIFDVLLTVTYEEHHNIIYSTFYRFLNSSLINQFHIKYNMRNANNLQQFILNFKILNIIGNHYYEIETEVLFIKII